jgi:hypothetical protein
MTLRKRIFFFLSLSPWLVRDFIASIVIQACDKSSKKGKLNRDETNQK